MQYLDIFFFGGGGGPCSKLPGLANNTKRKKERRRIKNYFLAKLGIGSGTPSRASKKV